MARREQVFDNDGFEVTKADVSEGPEMGVCKECGEPCIPKTIDTGIGVYEYGDERAVDVALEEVSPCCEAEVVKTGMLEFKLYERKN